MKKEKVVKTQKQYDLLIKKGFTDNVILELKEAININNHLFNYLILKSGTVNAISGGTVNEICGGTVNAICGGTVNEISDGTVNAIYGGTVNAISGGTVNAISGGVYKLYANGNILFVKNATIIQMNCDKKIEKAVNVQYIKHIPVYDFCFKDYERLFNPEKVNDNEIIMYKTVQDNFTDFRTGTIKYEIGKNVVCPDWKNIECGNGLHLCAKPYQAQSFHSGKLLKCRVKISDIRVHNNPEYPTKVRCKKVFVIEEVKEVKQ